MRFSSSILIALLVALPGSQTPLLGQTPPGASSTQSTNDAPLTDRERMLLDRIAKLEQRVETLESKLAAAPQPAAAAATPAGGVPQAPAPASPPAANVASTPTPGPVPASFLGGTTLNVDVDAYYAFNFNNPIGRVNLLRAYDVSSNAFSLNQAGLILDNQANPAEGKRWGFRLDLQYGQATETLQGNASNEPRPDIYRNVFQAYGTYVIPIGNGLEVDFGKFVSALGFENNYTKDQINYSRSFWFNFLPFYHMGARLNYAFNSKFAVNYWLVNGTQQTEPFNGYKDEYFGLAITPTKNISWNVNYYLGQEHPDTEYFSVGSGPSNAPTLQGTPFLPIVNPPSGKLHIFDSYASWQVNPKVLLGIEADDEISRLYTYSSPSHTIGGSLYGQYQWKPKVAFAGRTEYLSDRGGLFTGVTQAVKETTFTTKYMVVDGFDLFAEWRRDFSNRPFFFTDTLGVLKKEQNTATLGLVWWWGGKQGVW